MQTVDLHEDPREKIVDDYSDLAEKVKAWRVLKKRIVVTIGSWDNLHIGHVRYLIEAKKHGDVLIVGVDSDRGIKAYKGPLRPVIPQGERCEMLSYQEPVGYVSLIDDIDDEGAWGYELIRVLQPDVFVAVEDSYPDAQIAEIEKFCNQVVVLPRQAETSTSKTIHDTVKSAMMMSIPDIAKLLSDELKTKVGEILTSDRITAILQDKEERGRR